MPPHPQASATATHVSLPQRHILASNFSSVVINHPSGNSIFQAYNARSYASSAQDTGIICFENTIPVVLWEESRDSNYIHRISVGCFLGFLHRVTCTLAPSLCFPTEPYFYPLDKADDFS